MVSEYAPGTPPARHRFLARNRLVAALGSGVVVVEAALRSGATSTAYWGRDLARPVMAVPGPVTALTSTGCHRLIREGTAVLVTSAAEVAEHAGPMGELAPEAVLPLVPTDGLDPTTARVLEALPARGPALEGTLAESSGVVMAEGARCAGGARTWRGLRRGRRTAGCGCGAGRDCWPPGAEFTRATGRGCGRGRRQRDDRRHPIGHHRGGPPRR